ncbi:MAG: putative HD phosphohydrolase [Paraglaciecola psychrophila]|jgi:predicted HD phosphohydrolase
MKQVSFIAMEQGTAADYAFLAEQEQQYIAGLPQRLTEALLKLQHSLPGYQLSVLEHSLQSATRAHRAGESEQLVVAAYCTILAMNSLLTPTAKW